MESESLPFGASYNSLFILLGILKQDISIEVLMAFIGVLILLVLSGMVSGSEIAFFSFGDAEIEKLRQSENKQDRKILEILQNKKKLLSTILISNNFINVTIIVLSNYILSRVFNFGNNNVLEVLINVFIVTTFLVFFGEVMPKILASKKNFIFARVTLPLINIFDILFLPFSFLLSKFGNYLDNKIEIKSEGIDLKKIEKAIDLGVDKNTKDKDKKMLKGIVHFGNTMVKQIMKPRVDVFAINKDELFDKVIQKIQESGYSRIPVFEENLDTIVGILYIKDLLPHFTKSNSFQWQKTLRDIDFVSESKKIDDLLREMQESKLHMSIVVDEYGGTLGLITLEDILEEVVGEITDEFDKSKGDKYVQNTDGSYSFDGKIPLLDMCKIVGIDIGSFEDFKGESDTLAGLILEKTGKMPYPGHIVELGDFEFKIVKTTKKRIEKINFRVKS